MAFRSRHRRRRSRASRLSTLVLGTDRTHDDAMLTVSGLTKRYGDVIALNGATFTVPPGRIVGFLGPNWAGKTTTMRCIFGLADPDAGQISWDGHPVTHADRLRFGYMPEERGLYPKMRIKDQLTYFGTLSGLPRPDAALATDRWLEVFGLTDRATARLDELSHGNQQRVQLATALVHGPELLVLDEPFAGLDPLGVDAMAKMLAEEAAAGVGIVFSSHQLDLVEDVCEDVVIIDHGAVVMAGPVDDLRSSSDRVRIEVTVDGKAWTPSIEGLVQVGRNQRQTSFLADRTVELEDVLTAATAGGDVTSFSFGPPHLSDLFVEAVRR